MPDGNSLFSIARISSPYMGCSTFSECLRAARIAVAKSARTLRAQGLLQSAGGVTTGIGAVIQHAKVDAGAKWWCSAWAASALNGFRRTHGRAPTRSSAVDLNPGRRRRPKMRHDALGQIRKGRRVILWPLGALTDVGADHSFMYRNVT